MEQLRKLVNWLQKHPLKAVLIGVGLIVGLIIVANIKNRNEGILTDPLKKGTIIQSVYGIGTVLANHSFQLKPAVVSSIRELFVKEGDSVKKGDKLALLDSILYKAPFDGTVTALPFKVGENVFAQAPVLSLVNLEDRYLLVSLEQQGALRVEKGQTVIMSFDSIRDQNYEGVVESVYSNDNNFFARINVSKLNPKILPGMTADVAIQIMKHENALLLPIAAFNNGGVWVKRSSIASFTPLKLGIVDKEMGELIEGDLKEGDHLLIKQKASK